MSQAKVDRYKEEKKNRAKIMRKEKLERKLSAACAGLIAIALVGWAGFSVYRIANPVAETEETAMESYTVNTDALDSYLNSLSAD